VSALEPGLPSFSVVARALRTTTDRLAGEIRAPSDVPPDWSRFEWQMARAAATMQGCAGLLAAADHWRGADEWREFLAGQYGQIAAIQDNARQLLGRIDEVTRLAGIPCVALKGSALLALGLLARGTRSMGDVDLLVRPTDTDAIGAALHMLGYRRGHWSRRHLTYYPPAAGRSLVIGEHRDNPLRIEVHPHISEELPLSQVDITSTIWPADAPPGINRYASLAALMRHNLLHAAGNLRAQALRHIQLLDTASLARRMRDEDWHELQDPARGETWWMYPVLHLASRYFPGHIPEYVLAQAAEHCPRLLRARAQRYTLHEVSWSNLRIAAFPGCEWARTPLEALRFARSRLFPRRATLEDLRAATAFHAAMNHLPWYRVSHARRVLRWLTSRPRRVQTMHALHAALAEESP